MQQSNSKCAASCLCVWEGAKLARWRSTSAVQACRPTAMCFRFHSCLLKRPFPGISVWKGPGQSNVIIIENLCCPHDGLGWNWGKPDLVLTQLGSLLWPQSQVISYWSEVTLIFLKVQQSRSSASLCLGGIQLVPSGLQDSVPCSAEQLLGLVTFRTTAEGGQPHSSLLQPL